MVVRLQQGQVAGSTQVPSLLEGLSPMEQAQLLMWTQNTRSPNLENFLQQLGLNKDTFSGGAKVNAQVASQGRNLDVYTAGGGLDSVSNGGALHIGHSGQGVKDLQRMLNSMGANLEVDGKFGPKTEAALKAFQAARPSEGGQLGVLDAGTLANLRQGGASLTSEQWGRYAPDYNSSRGTLDADRRRVLDSRAKPLEKGVLQDDSGKPLPKGTKGLLDQIGNGEIAGQRGTADERARAHGFNSAYDVTLGFGAYTPEHLKGKPITEMTLGEVKELQRGMLNHPRNDLNSSAVGKYQIVGTTLRGLQREMGLSDDAKFTPELQDRMATRLLERRGLSDFQAGRISASQFQNNLSKEWASIARSDTGGSHYGQATGTTTAQIQNAISGLNA